jgi:hypothetical protein
MMMIEAIVCQSNDTIGPQRDGINVPHHSLLPQ